MAEPTIIQRRAIDVTPYRFGIWCSIADGEPFVNDVVHRAWSDDGHHIWFGLDSHNFDKRAPDELMDVVEIIGYVPTDQDERDAEFLASRPVPRVPRECPHCGQEIKEEHA